MASPGPRFRILSPDIISNHAVSLSFSPSSVRVRMWGGFRSLVAAVKFRHLFLPFDRQRRGKIKWVKPSHSIKRVEVNGAAPGGSSDPRLSPSAAPRQQQTRSVRRAAAGRGARSRKQLVWKPKGPAGCQNVAGLGEGSGSIRKLVGQESLAAPRREGERARGGGRLVWQGCSGFHPAW